MKLPTQFDAWIKAVWNGSADIDDYKKLTPIGFMVSGFISLYIGLFTGNVYLLFLVLFSPLPIIFFYPHIMRLALSSYEKYESWASKPLLNVPFMRNIKRSSIINAPLMILKKIITFIGRAFISILRSIFSLLKFAFHLFLVAAVIAALFIAHQWSQRSPSSPVQRYWYAEWKFRSESAREWRELPGRYVSESDCYANAQLPEYVRGGYEISCYTDGP